ncbi:unnamed protein product [Cuscuta campestris]|uniref:CTLH domain-containing protein n=2 Tax=Cuscuta sect. Cleistogrammica TaxID=1824901 RepID=A0A484NHE4_9ASTE|nr:hypothetical protein DM860_011997 [Cuscuta australis]VFR00551.1 unnamed protein product [Cuscuta campestris]
MDCSEEELGEKRLIKKRELVRLIIQSLYSLGYRKSGECLESESGISCKSAEFGALESKVVDANWDGCFELINGLEGLADEQRASALVLVLQQCLLECLKNGDDSAALKLLRKQIARLKVGKENVSRLAYELISPKESGTDLVSNMREKLVTELENVLPPPITLPPRRLERLVEMAISSQIDSCIYHSISSVSLYEDHHCDRAQFPTRTSQILSNHGNEVWYVQFSNNGEYLASSSSDCSAIIWKVPCDDGEVTKKHALLGHTKPVSSVSWSPDDTMLLTCGNMEVVKLWDVETGTFKRTFGDDDIIVNSCAWFPNSKRIVCGSSDPENGIYMWDCEGNEIKVWKGMRMPKVLDLAVTPDGENLISVFADKEIRILNVGTNSERIIAEEHPITSLSVSGDGKFFIVNLNSQAIHMWDVAGEWVTPTKYEGHKQHQYVIRSCFGGLNSSFIASGSEDSMVYIWNRKNSKPLEILSGHSKTVNCVSWNPRRHQMLASASDDQTIRIWGPSTSTS